MAATHRIGARLHPLTIEQNASPASAATTRLFPVTTNHHRAGRHIPVRLYPRGADGVFSRGMQCQGMSFWMTLRYGPPLHHSSFIPTLPASFSCGSLRAPFARIPTEMLLFRKKRRHPETRLKRRWAFCIRYILIQKPISRRRSVHGSPADRFFRQSGILCANAALKKAAPPLNHHGLPNASVTEIPGILFHHTVHHFEKHSAEQRRGQAVGVFDAL
jgi:hypothetical protein